jgi:hypothetical protein
MMTKTQVQALFQTKVSVGDPNEFTAFWGLRLGRKKMGRVANTVRALSAQPLFLQKKRFTCR